MSINANLTNLTKALYVCSESFTEGIYHHLIFISTFSVFLCIITFSGNALILVALRKESTLGSPSKLLLRSLATSDLFVGMFSDPLVAIYWVSALKEHWSVCYYAISTGFFLKNALCTVSLLTTCAISVDRLLALSLGIRYRETVTLKRVYGIIITFWVLAAVHSAFSVNNFEFSDIFSHTVICVCLAVSMSSHTMIFFSLRKYRIRVHTGRSSEDPPIAESSQEVEVSVAKHRKAVSSVLWIQLALLICYLPYFVIVALLYIRGHSEPSKNLVLSRQYGVVFVLVNSALNPLLYCWKIPDVRQAVVSTLKNCRCS